MSGTPDQDQVWITTLAHVVKDLESYGPASEGAVHIDLDEGALTGNRAGFVHLAAALVRAVTGPEPIDLPFEFVSDDGSITIKTLSCDNHYVAPPAESLAEKATDYIGRVGCICVLLTFVLGMLDFVYRIDAYLASSAFVVLGGTLFSAWMSGRLRRKRLRAWSGSIRS